MHTVDWSTLASTIFGGALSVGLARAYIAKMLATVDQLEKTVAALATTLAVLTVRAETVAALEKGHRDHDRKITKLEAHVYGSRHSGEDACDA